MNTLEIYTERDIKWLIKPHQRLDPMVSNLLVTYISQRNKAGIFTLQHSWKGFTRACLESPLPANLTSLQTTLRVCISKYCNIKKRSVLIWWMAWYLPRVIFAIQMTGMDGNWRHCCKKNAQRIPILSSEVSHKLNFFSLTLNFGMVMVIYSFLSQNFEKTTKELYHLFNLNEANVGWLRVSCLSFFASHFSFQLSTSF